MKNKGKFIFAALVIFLVIIIAYSEIRYGKIFRHNIKFIGHITHFNPRRFRDFILGYGKFAALIYVLVYSLKPVLLVVPTSILSVIAGSIFGPWMAFFLSMISTFLGASLAFLLANKLGKPFVDKILRGKAMKLGEGIEKHGFMIILLMRLSFIFAFDPLSYAAGLTKMKYRDFILGTMIGIAPEMLAYSFMGKNIEHPLTARFVTPILLIMLVALVSYTSYSFYKKKRQI
ncbi:MAG: TVP38/TMEM64 family protein [Bacillota bacterium]|nr:TVP38/TMEM64 family protein [Bacillota bacterium]